MAASATAASSAPPDTSSLVSLAEIRAAAHLLRGVAVRTPLLPADDLAAELGVEAIFLKPEMLQRGGAFKFRGAFAFLASLPASVRARGVIAPSSGNHAQAVALAAKIFGVPATLVMPTTVTAVKRSGVERLGGHVELAGTTTADRMDRAQELSDSTGGVLVPPYDDARIIAGQGTATLELIDEIGPLDALVVPVGGGGLLSGSAIAATERSPGCAIYGVEPEAGNDGQRSFRSGEIVNIPVPDTIADGARTQHIGTLVLPILRALVHDIVTVSDDQLRTQMRFFMERMKIVVEPTGCLGAAAVMQHAIDLKGKRVGIILTGGNVDPATFCECMSAAGSLS